MSITLPPTQQSGMERCARAFLFPSNFTDRNAFRIACIAATRQLLNDDMVGLPSADLASSRPFRDNERLAIRADVASFWKLDIGYQTRRREFGYQVLHLSLLVPRQAMRVGSAASARAASVKLCQCTAGSAGAESMASPTMLCRGCREYAVTQLGEGLSLVRILVPAFQAAARTALHRDPQHSELALLFALFADTLLAGDSRGEMAFAAPAIAKVPAFTPDPTQLCEEMHRLGEEVVSQHVPAFGQGITEISHWPGTAQSAHRQHRPRGRTRGRPAPSAGPVLLLSLKSRLLEPGSSSAAEARLALTAREYDVAALLAERRSNREIAAALGISSHTARHHTEQVLAKLGVHSRAGVRARVTRER